MWDRKQDRACGIHSGCHRWGRSIWFSQSYTTRNLDRVTVSRILAVSGRGDTKEEAANVSPYHVHSRVVVDACMLLLHIALR